MTTTTTRIDAETGETIYTNVTFVVSGEMMGAYQAVFARELRVRFGKWAQYERAMHVRFLAPRKRNYRGKVVTPEASPVFILEGDQSHLKQEVFGKAEVSASGTSIRSSRHSGFSGEWAREIIEQIESENLNVLLRFGRA